MNYLLYGIDTFLIDKEIKNIIKKHQINDISITKYDLSCDSLKIILDDSKTISFFEELKLIIVDNATIFNRVKTEHNTDLLVEYLNNPNPTTILVFINQNNTIDNTKKISKLIKEKGIVKEIINSDINQIVKNMFTGYTIESNIVNLIIKRVGDNLALIESEVEKLKIYKIEEKNITEEDVMELTTTNIDTDIFKFIDNIIDKEKNIAMSIYTEMIKQGEEPIKIIALLASKFRLMYQATELTKMGCSQQDISTTLNTHIYPVKLAINAGLKYNHKILLNYLKRLANLDIEIKTGKIEPVLGLELFILDV
jgi:DNA polymerase III, delta subunit